MKVSLELQLYAAEQARLADMPHFKEKEGIHRGKDVAANGKALSL